MLPGGQLHMRKHEEGIESQAHIRGCRGTTYRSYLRGKATILDSGSRLWDMKVALQTSEKAHCALALPTISQEGLPN